MCIRDRAGIAYCLRVLTDYLDLLHDWRECYKPASPEEPHDPRFEEALHTTETIEHLTDCVAFGTPQDVYKRQAHWPRTSSVVDGRFSWVSKGAAAPLWHTTLLAKSCVLHLSLIHI